MNISNIMIALFLSSKCVSSTTLSRDSSVRGGHQDSGSQDDHYMNPTVDLFADTDDSSSMLIDYNVVDLFDLNQSNETSLSEERFMVTDIDEEAFRITSDHDHNFRDNQEEDHIRGKDLSDDTSSDIGLIEEEDHGLIQGDIVMADTATQSGSDRGTKGHHGRKSRFQNKHNNEKTETVVAAQIVADEIEEESLCLWSGTGCDGDCDENEMVTFCSKLDTMEKCDGTKDEDLKCVWAQKVAEKGSFLMDSLMASRHRYPLKFHVIGGMTLTASILLIVLAVYASTQWWRYRGYTKLGDDAEGDLLATIV